MIAAGNSCRALKAASFSRVTEPWRMAMQVAGYLLAAAGLLGLVVLPPSAVAQARAGVPRIGILFFGAARSVPARTPKSGTCKGCVSSAMWKGRTFTSNDGFCRSAPVRPADARAAHAALLYGVNPHARSA
ncbi:MAG TPA: hypothetical protein VET87_09710 [Rubrivivax sp.]|jgi:hypothetical protein|nr:hypothetical protein [Rubrivivax sp.]